MGKCILVLDPIGMSPSFTSRLESELDCSVEISMELSRIRLHLDDIHPDAAIVNPYPEHGKLRESYVKFVKQDLRHRGIPVMIFSRVSTGKLAEGAGLDLDLVSGRDYQTYLKKPSPIDKFVEEVGKLIYMG